MVQSNNKITFNIRKYDSAEVVTTKYYVKNAVGEGN